MRENKVMAETLNSGAWEAFFQDQSRIHQIENYGFLDIGAQDLKKASLGREPRHMAKMDSSSDRPEVFKRLDINILPLSRSKYRIGKFNCFHKFPSFEERSQIATKFLSFPNDIESLNISEISSESSAIYAAQLGGIYEHFVGEKTTPTFSGRQGTNKFVFQVEDYSRNEISVEVDKAQIEIDGGLEGLSKVIIIEAKNSWRDDFNIRQLYFPYIHISSMVSKEVVPVYQIYENGIFTLIEYFFRDRSKFNSLELRKMASYAFSQDAVSVRSILKEISEQEIGYGAPFPQADNFDLILDLVSACYVEDQEVSKLLDRFGYDERQMGSSGYYPNAAIFLGLISKSLDSEGRTIFRISKFGIDFMDLDVGGRNSAAARLILQIPGAKSALLKFIEGGRDLSPNSVLIELQEGKDFSDLSETTQRRRAQTVASWLNWIVRRDMTLTELV